MNGEWGNLENVILELIQNDEAGKCTLRWMNRAVVTFPRSHLEWEIFKSLFREVIWNEKNLSHFFEKSFGMRKI